MPSHVVRGGIGPSGGFNSLEWALWLVTVIIKSLIKKKKACVIQKSTTLHQVLPHLAPEG